MAKDGTELDGAQIQVQPVTNREKDLKTLYVCNFSKNITILQLRAAFEPFGRIDDIRMPSSTGSDGKIRRFAFVQFAKKVYFARIA